MPLLVRGGVGGKSTKDATAVPGDVKKGKIFYNNQGRQIGTAELLATKIFRFEKGTELQQPTYNYSHSYCWGSQQKGVDVYNYFNSGTGFYNFKNGYEHYIFQQYSGESNLFRQTLEIDTNVALKDIESISVLSGSYKYNIHFSEYFKSGARNISGAVYETQFIQGLTSYFAFDCKNIENLRFVIGSMQDISEPVTLKNNVQITVNYKGA